MPLDPPVMTATLPSSFPTVTPFEHWNYHCTGLQPCAVPPGNPEHSLQMSRAVHRLPSFFESNGDRQTRSSTDLHDAGGGGGLQSQRDAGPRSHGGDSE